MCEFTNGKALLVLSVITFTFSISSRFVSNIRRQKMQVLLWKQEKEHVYAVARNLFRRADESKPIAVSNSLRYHICCGNRREWSNKTLVCDSAIVTDTTQGHAILNWISCLLILLGKEAQSFSRVFRGINHHQRLCSYLPPQEQCSPSYGIISRTDLHLLTPSACVVHEDNRFVNGKIIEFSAALQVIT